MTSRKVFVAGLVVALGTLAVLAQDRQAPDAPRPIDVDESLWTEELTFMEIRDAIRNGTTTVIVGTGGVEQNGPYVAGGKHNFVLQTVLPYIARAIAPALIAPIVKFVPEGSIEPPSGHMAYAGTIGLEQATFEALLTDICRSFRPMASSTSSFWATAEETRLAWDASPRRSTNGGRRNACECTISASTTTKTSGAGTI